MHQYEIEEHHGRFEELCKKIEAERGNRTVLTLDTQNICRDVKTGEDDSFMIAKLDACLKYLEDNHPNYYPVPIIPSYALCRTSEDNRVRPPSRLK